MVGRKLVTEVTTADALAVLTPIWTSKPETATRVRQRMATVFDWAIAQGLRTDNPANGAIDKALPRRARLQAHHPALPYADVPDALSKVRASTAKPAIKLAFELMVLTAARAGEVRGARWEEIDLEARIWTIPAARMKARREHRIPLSGRAVAVLEDAKALDRGNGVVFPNPRSGKPISDMAFTELIRREEIPCVPHGFRSTFRDWVIEQTSLTIGLLEKLPWRTGWAIRALKRPTHGLTFSSGGAG